MPRDVEYGVLGWGIAQDMRGAILVGDIENNQVLIFDGGVWRSVVVPYSPIDLAADDQGFVWVGTENGLGKIVRRDNGEYTFEIEPLEVPETIDQKLYCSADLGDVTALYGRRVCVHLKNGKVIATQIVNEEEQVVGVDEGHFFVFEPDSQIVRCKTIDGKLTHTLDVGDRSVAVIVRLDAERLLIWSHGFEVYEDGKISKFSPLLNAMAERGKKPLFVYPLLDGLAVGMHGELLFLDLQGNLKYRLGVRDGLSDHLISRMCADRDGNLWTTTSQNISCIYHSNPVRRLVDEGGDIKKCYAINGVTDRDNLLLYSPSRLVIFDDEEKNSHTSWPGMDVFSIGHDKRILFGDRYGIYELKNGRRVRLAKAKGEFFTGCVHESTIVLGQRDGTYRIGTLKDESIQEIQKIRLLDESYILGIDDDQKVWIVSRPWEAEAIICADFAKGWDVPPRIVKSNLSIFDKRFNCNGRTLLVTGNRFDKLQLIGDEIEFVEIPEVELDESKIDSEYAWKLRGEGRSVVEYAIQDSLERRTQPRRRWVFPETVEAIHRRGNQLIVAGENAVYTKSLESEYDRSLRPPVVSWMIFDEGQVSGASLGDVTESSRLTFWFSCLSFNAIEPTEYRFRLNGLDRDFSNWSTQSEVTYFRLPPGKYQLEVEARRYGAEIVSSTSPSFEVPAAFFRSPLAILGYFLSALAIVWGLFSLRYRNVAKRRRKLEKVVEEQTQQLQEQSASLRAANNKLREEIQAVKESEQRRSELEDRLLESERLESLGQLAGGIAHDFNNMLSVVMTNAELMVDLDSENKECQEQIILISQQAAELCNQMLMVSGGGSVDIQVHDLNDIVRSISNLLDATVQPLRLELEFSDDSLPVEVDRSQITQLVLNLITNAADATRSASGSKVCLKTGSNSFTEEQLSHGRSIDFVPPPGKYVWLSVTDQGHGIDDETRRRMFDPFFSTKSQGRGLGLATVIRVVSRHFGAVNVDSKENAGTCMQILLPVSFGAAESGLSTSAPDKLTGILLQAPILLIDDDDAIRKAMTRMLGKAGFECESFDNGAEGVAVARESRFAAAIVDLSMPGMNGVDVIRELREIDKELPVVVISGFSLHNTTSNGLPTYKTRFLGKPFSRSDLIEGLMQLLEEEPTRAV